MGNYSCFILATLTVLKLVSCDFSNSNVNETIASGFLFDSSHPKNLSPPELSSEPFIRRKRQLRPEEQNQLIFRYPARGGQQPQFFNDQAFRQPRFSVIQNPSGFSSSPYFSNQHLSNQSPRFGLSQNSPFSSQFQPHPLIRDIKSPFEEFSQFFKSPDLISQFPSFLSRPYDEKSRPEERPQQHRPLYNVPTTSQPDRPPQHFQSEQPRFFQPSVDNQIQPQSQPDSFSNPVHLQRGHQIETKPFHVSFPSQQTPPQTPPQEIPSFRHAPELVNQPQVTPFPNHIQEQPALPEHGPGLTQFGRPQQPAPHQSSPFQPDRHVLVRPVNEPNSNELQPEPKLTAPNSFVSPLLQSFLDRQKAGITSSGPQLIPNTELQKPPTQQDNPILIRPPQDNLSPQVVSFPPRERPPQENAFQEAPRRPQEVPLQGGGPQIYLRDPRVRITQSPPPERPQVHRVPEQPPQIHRIPEQPQVHRIPEQPPQVHRVPEQPPQVHRVPEQPPQVHREQEQPTQAPPSERPQFVLRPQIHRVPERPSQTPRPERPQVILRPQVHRIPEQPPQAPPSERPGVILRPQVRPTPEQPQTFSHERRIPQSVPKDSLPQGLPQNPFQVLQPPEEVPIQRVPQDLSPPQTNRPDIYPTRFEQPVATHPPPREAEPIGPQIISEPATRAPYEHQTLPVTTQQFTNPNQPESVTTSRPDNRFRIRRPFLRRPITFQQRPPQVEQPASVPSPQPTPQLQPEFNDQRFVVSTVRPQLQPNEIEIANKPIVQPPIRQLEPNTIVEKEPQPNVETSQATFGSRIRPKSLNRIAQPETRRPQVLIPQRPQTTTASVITLPTIRPQIVVRNFQTTTISPVQTEAPTFLINTETVPTTTSFYRPTTRISRFRRPTLRIQTTTQQPTEQPRLVTQPEVRQPSEQPQIGRQPESQIIRRPDPLNRPQLKRIRITRVRNPNVTSSQPQTEPKNSQELSNDQRRLLQQWLVQERQRQQERSQNKTVGELEGDKRLQELQDQQLQKQQEAKRQELQEQDIRKQDDAKRRKELQERQRTERRQQALQRIRDRRIQEAAEDPRTVTTTLATTTALEFNNGFDGLRRNLSPTQKPFGGSPQARALTTPKSVRTGNRGSPSLVGGALPYDIDNDGVPGAAGKDYPILTQIPKTSFSCSGAKTDGYYADTEAGCQVVHLCQSGGIQDSFLCPNGTIFNQEKFSCQWWFEVDCKAAPQFYTLNDNRYRNGLNGDKNNLNNQK